MEKYAGQGDPVAGGGEGRQTCRGAGRAGTRLLTAEDSARHVLVGATSVGPAGGEVLGVLAVAVHAQVPVTPLQAMIYAYPTFHRALEAALADLASSGHAPMRATADRAPALLPRVASKEIARHGR